MAAAVPAHAQGHAAPIEGDPYCAESNHLGDFVTVTFCLKCRLPSNAFQ